MNETIVGTCSCCKGPVTVPLAWWGIVPPTPTCQRCGAKAAENYGPEIQTVPVKQWTTTGTGPWDYDVHTSPRLNKGLTDKEAWLLKECAGD